MEAMRKLCIKDPFFLLIYVLHRKDADNDWVFDRVREYFQNPWGYLDEWPREHYKSTIITFLAIIYWVITDSESTHGIFSFNRPIAKAFLRQIKQELENNELLKQLFPDVLWASPKKDAPKWSEDEGITVMRKGNPKEQTIEAWGLTDGQPTSKHFTCLHYDDIVTIDSVRTPDMIRKTTESTQLSFNLGSKDGSMRSFAGTRYHYADTYKELVDSGACTLRKYAATKDGTLSGEPWLWSREVLGQKMRDMGQYVAACQLFNEPRLESKDGFSETNIRYWPASNYANLNVFLIADPASTKKKTSDYTVFIAVGLGADNNYYIIDWVRDRLNLTERANVLFSMHQKYHPINVGYERYGLQSDIEHFIDLQNRTNYRFPIIELGGSDAKEDRIKKLGPLFETQRIWIPETSPHTQYNHEPVDVTRLFVNEEYKAFPYCVHDDMLDCLARIVDPKLGAYFPRGVSCDPWGALESSVKGRGTARRKEYNPLDY
jgi:phage terminase large subunit-like protein